MCVVCIYVYIFICIYHIYIYVYNLKLFYYSIIYFNTCSLFQRIPINTLIHKGQMSLKVILSLVIIKIQPRVICAGIKHFYSFLILQLIAHYAQFASIKSHLLPYFQATTNKSAQVLIISSLLETTEK